MAATRTAHGGVLIVGGGFAGSDVARLLGRRGATIVSRENFMLFTPILPEAASGTLEPRHVVVPLRIMCPHAELLLGRLVALDEAADAATDPSALESNLTFVFVGAGYAGVEALAELADLVRDALRYYPRLRGVPQRWVLVDAAPKILPEIPRRLGEYAAAQLAKRGVDIRVETTLVSAEDGLARLSDGTELPTRTLVWTAGVRANPLLAALGLPLDERGRVRVDPALRVVGRENVWALGDCASVPNEATPDRPDPPTSQHALRQARRLAKNLRGQPKPYRYRELGMGATLGRHKGIVSLLGLPLRGFLGWFVTRTYHLYQLPLFSRKARAVTDWTVGLFFRRDIAELGTLGHPTRLGDESSS